jgi:transcriptional regulator with XRE-family HTH domain
MKSIDFKRFMFEQKIKQSELAQYLKVSEGYISQVASGKKQLSDENFSKVLNNPFGWDVSMLTKNQPEIPAEEKPMVSNSLLEYLQRKIEQLERENAELLQENAVLRYENMMLTPRKGDAEDVAGSLSADAI